MAHGKTLILRGIFATPTFTPSHVWGAHHAKNNPFWNGRGVRPKASYRASRRNLFRAIRT